MNSKAIKREWAPIKRTNFRLLLIKSTSDLYNFILNGNNVKATQYALVPFLGNG